MLGVCAYFQVHQPYRLRKFTFFDIGKSSSYKDEQKNRDILWKITRKCYLPMNALIRRLIDQHEGNFKVSFSISGTAIDQFKAYAPEVIESFQDLVKTGCVEVLSETYNHSLSYLFSENEFRQQVTDHQKLMTELFGVTPETFRNTELIYNNNIAATVADMGYKRMLCEGADHILGWQSPHYLYRPSNEERLVLLLKSYKLSDDIAFRFSNKGWNEYPLNAEKFASWVNALHGSGQVVNLFMDYETFGEHQWEDTGIFQFMEALPRYLLLHPDTRFMTPAETTEHFSPVGKLDVPFYTSWADTERDLTAWLGNELQMDAIKTVYALEDKVKEANDPAFLRTWKNLQTSDHFYYMCTKWFSDGDVHSYFNPYSTPYDAYINYMNVVSDFALRLEEALAVNNEEQHTLGQQKEALLLENPQV